MHVSRNKNFGKICVSLVSKGIIYAINIVFWEFLLLLLNFYAIIYHNFSYYLKLIRK